MFIFYRFEQGSCVGCTQVKVLSVKNIELKQDPSEVLDLEMRFDTFYNAHSHFDYRYEIPCIEIKFHNNLHELDTNYVYEVLCKRYYDMEFPDQCLFSFITVRCENVIIGSLSSCFSTSYPIQDGFLCFYIRRIYRYNRVNEAMQYMNFRSFFKEVATDINLLVDDESLTAHQLVLSHSSDVFKAMFSSKMLEKSTSVVKIEDFSKEVIAEMLNFMYTGRIDKIEMRYELLKVAHKYQMHDLYNRCKEYIIFNSSCENIVETLEIADLFDIKPLKGRALKFIYKHKADMSKEPSYHDYLCRTMNLDNVVNILLLATDYDIERVTTKAFDFISENFCKLNGNKQFNKLFESNPSLMKEIFNYYCNNHALSCTAK